MNIAEDQTTINSNNKKLSFVKRLTKLSSNKLYHISNSKSFKNKEQLDSSLLLDSKLSNNTNLNYINNQFGEN